MSRPKFLPALRGLLGAGSVPSLGTGMEAKSLTVSSVTGQVINLSGSTSTTILPRGYEQSAAGTGRADAWDVEMATSAGYERVVWVYRCVELMSGDASRLPFRIGRDLGTEKQEVLEDHPLYRVLNRRANPHETARTFRKRLGAILLLSKKGAFIEVTKSRAGTVNRLDLMHPQRVRPIASDSGDYIDRFEYTRLDGRVVVLEPSRVKWIKEPHPLDPFSGVTPLEAAGMSVELDFLSRIYNVQFIKNDSRPGGVLGVDADGMADEDLDRLERKFEPGVHAAGKITVLGTGPGGLNYVDTTTKPRDMAYHEAANNAKAEILAAFGIGESVLGNAAGRTFDNAEQELYNYWTGPMTPYLDLIATAFEDDVDDEWDCYLDTSGVQVLELPRRRAREEAMKEYNAGLRSIDEYRPLADLPELGSPQSRALWISPAKAPVPFDDEDAKVLNGEGDPTTGGMPGEGAPEGGEVPLQEGGMSAAEVVDAARNEGAPAGTAQNAIESARAVPVDTGSGMAGAVVADARTIGADLDVPEEAAAAVAAARMEGKSLEDDDVVADEPPDGDYAKVELAVATILTAEFARHKAIITARLESPKTRKGTRFWTPESEGDTRGGDEPVDATKAVNAGRLGPATIEAVSSPVRNAAEDAAVAMLTALAAAGLFGAAAYTTAELARAAAFAARAPFAAVMAMISEAVATILTDAEQVIVTAEPDAQSITDLVTAVQELYDQRGEDLARKVAESAAFAAINGARDAAAGMLMPDPGTTDLDLLPVVERTWVSREDDRVRPAHVAAHGTVRPVGAPFIMEGASVAYPRDPAAPPHLTYGCRCRLRYHVTFRRRGVGMLLPATP